MKWITCLYVFSFIALINKEGFAQSGETHLKSQIEAVNLQLAGAFASNNPDRLIHYYDNEAVFMPEFHKTLCTKNDILNYFRQWFELTQTNSIKWAIYEVERIGSYLLETGTFTRHFTQANADSFHYEGKYIRIWKMAKNETLSILSEIRGASDYLDRSKLPLIENRTSNEIPELNVSEKLLKEVRLRNETITKLVKSRQGEKHATLFMPDAIYMPYYKPMHIGMQSIKSYFSEHEKPGDINIDSLQISTGKIIDMGNFVLEHGYYRIRWRAIDNSANGLVTGKSINLWKRNENGELLLYRQMVNHD